MTRCARSRRRGSPAPQLTLSEVVTLALFAQWRQFGSERAFYRYAVAHLRAAFPRLPARSQYQYKRLLRRCHDALVALGQRLAAKVALHNVCLWLNVRLRRPPLAVADLIDW